MSTSKQSKESPYFVRRSPPKAKDFEEGYWGVVRDPDGVTRNLLAERDRRIEDVRDELHFINQLKPGRILDVGCGLGYFLSAVDPRWEKHGIELSNFAAQHASRYAKVHVGDLSSAVYPDNHFDAVMLYHVIEHMVDPVAELREIRRVLKPGGTLVVGTPNFDSACARRFGDRYRMLSDVTHISLFSESSLRQLLIDEGFEVDHVDFPFFETRHFTTENFARLADTSKVSPAFYGNIMTFYTRRSNRSAAVALLASAGRLLHRLAVEQEATLDQASALLGRTMSSGGQIVVAGENAVEQAGRLSGSGYRATAWVDPAALPPGITVSDLLLIVAHEDVPRQLVEAADRRRVPVVALLGENAPTPGAAIALRVPTADCLAVEIVQYFMTTIIGLAAPPLSVPHSAA